MASFDITPTPQPTPWPAYGAQPSPGAAPSAVAPQPAPAPTPTYVPVAERGPRYLTDAEFQVGMTFDDAKLLSELSYTGVVGQRADGWQVEKVYASGVSGLRAILVHSTDPANPRAVLAFAGTDPLSPVDVATDFEQSLGSIPLQYREARGLVRSLAETYGDSLILTGHSLGGGIAGYTGELLGVRAVGINSAPLGLGTRYDVARRGLDPDGAGIVQLNVEGEFVSSSLGRQPGTICTVEGEHGLLPVFTDHLLGAVQLDHEVLCDTPFGALPTPAPYPLAPLPRDLPTPDAAFTFEFDAGAPFGAEPYPWCEGPGAESAPQPPTPAVFDDDVALPWTWADGYASYEPQAEGLEEYGECATPDLE